MELPYPTKPNHIIQYHTRLYQTKIWMLDDCHGGATLDSPQITVRSETGKNNVQEHAKRWSFSNNCQKLWRSCQKMVILKWLTETVKKMAKNGIFSRDQFAAYVLMKFCCSARSNLVKYDNDWCDDNMPGCLFDPVSLSKICPSMFLILSPTTPPALRSILAKCAVPAINVD